jgi:O-antigen/teichoic acid export membrane protein
MRLKLDRLRPKPTPAWSQALLLVATALRMVCSLGLTILVGRSISPAAFGTFALVATVFGLAHEFTDMGTGNVAVRVAARARSSERTVLEQLLGLRLLLSLMASLTCIGYALAQADPMVRLMLLATGTVLAFSSVSACSTVFQLRQAQIRPAALSVLSQVVTLLVAAVMLAVPVADAWFPAAVVAREAAIALGTLLLAVDLVGYMPRPRFSGPSLKSFFGSAAVVALATLTYHVQLQGGMLWVQVLRPEAELGAFAAAQRPLAPLLFIPWIIMLPLVPVLSWLAAARREAFTRQSQAAVDLSLGLGAVMAVVTWRTAEPLLAFLYGGRFSDGPLSAVATLHWLAPALGCAFALAAIATILVADHREWALLKLSAAGLALYSALNLLLLPGLGFMGTAIATAVALAALNAGGFVLLATIGIVPRLRTLAVLLPALILYPLLLVLPGTPFVQLLAATPLTLAGLLTVWFFPGLTADRTEQAGLTQEVLAGHE